MLNKKLSPSSRISRPERLLEMMDIDGSDGIDINEFFVSLVRPPWTDQDAQPYSHVSDITPQEVFRLVDAADGSVDGKISIVDGPAEEA